MRWWTRTFSRIGGLKSAHAFSILMKAGQVDVAELVVYEAIGEEGWKILAKAMPTGTLPDIIVTWDALGRGIRRREDIKRLSNAGHDFQIYDTLEDLQANNWRESVCRQGHQELSRKSEENKSFKT